MSKFLPTNLTSYGSSGTGSGTSGPTTTGMNLRGLYGFDNFYLNTRWTGAGTNVFGFACAPNAIGLYGGTLLSTVCSGSTNGPAGAAGVTCSAVCALSDDPAMVLVCIHGKSATNAAIKNGDGPGVTPAGVLVAIAACLPLVLRRRCGFAVMAPLLVMVIALDTGVV